jgi:hypothetical protein
MKPISLTYPVTIALFALLLFPGVSAAIPQGSALSVSMLRYDPLPAEPGDVLDVYFVVANEGGSSGNNVKLEFIDNYPFSADNKEDAVKILPSLPGQENWVGRFKVRISQDATEGTSYVKVRLSIQDSNAEKDALFPIVIKTNDPVVAIKSIDVVPKNINPGTLATITISLENLADSRMKDISVKLSTQKTLGTTITTLPIAPLGDSLEKRVVSLGPGQEAQVSYTVIVEPGAASDVYRIPVTIDYSDESGNDYERSDEIGIMINAQPDLQVYLETLDIFTDKKQGDVTIKFVNRGLSKLKLVTAKLDESADFDVITQSRETYIGNIDSDDYETATFTLRVKTDAIKIPVTITYMDAFNNAHEKNVVLTANLISEKQNGQSSTAGIIIVVVIVLIIAFIIYRVVRKRNRKR